MDIKVDPYGTEKSERKTFFSDKKMSGENTDATWNMEQKNVIEKY